MSERWTSLESIGYPLYKISDAGTCKGPQGILKWGTSGKLKYPCVKLFSDINRGKGRIFTIHFLVATMFVHNPNNLDEISHEDNKPNNPKYDNLKWTTHIDNCRHTQAGEQSVHSKLTEQDVLWILDHFKRNDKNFGQTALSRKFNVGIATIGDIIAGRTWKHLYENTR